MKRIQFYRKILSVSTLALIFFSSSFVFVHATDYTVLAPLPNTTSCGANPTPGQTGCTSTLSQYLPNLFTLMIGVGAMAAFVVITIYGLEYMLSDSLGVKMNAKKMLTDALWGLGLIIFAWVILNYINPNLVKGSLNITTPQTAQNVTVTGGPNGSTSATGTTVDATATEGATAAAAESGTRYTLAQDNITVQNGPCASLTQTTCTDVGGLTSNTINQLETIGYNCKCNPVITGGNEPNGHDAGGSHPTGNAIDFASNSALDTYLAQNTGGALPANPVIGQTYTATLNGKQVNILYETTGTVAGGSTSNGPHVHITFVQ